MILLRVMESEVDNMHFKRKTINYLKSTVLVQYIQNSYEYNTIEKKTIKKKMTLYEFPNRFLWPGLDVL